MAVRFDANGDNLKTTSGLTANSFTICLWLKISTDLNTWSVIFNPSNSTEPALNTGSDGTTLQVSDSVHDVNGSNLTVGTWYHVAWVKTDVTHDIVYLNGVVDINNSSVDISGGSSSGLCVGDVYAGGGVRFDGCVYAIKAWDNVQLTQAEIQAEMYTVRPKRFANLHGWWPCLPGSGERARDYSGSGRNFTENGTLTDEDAPPVSWGNNILIMPHYAASGGTSYPMTITGALTPAGALSKSLQRSLSGGLTPAGALVKSLQRTLSGGLTPSGALSYVKGILRTFTGAVAPSGTLAKSTQRTLTGGIIPAGALIKSIAKSTLSGSVTPSGVLSYIKAILRSFSGSLTSSGTLARQTQKTIAGAVTPVGTMLKSIGKVTFTGSLTPSGALAYIKGILRNFSGSVTPSGTITARSVSKPLAGAVSPAGNLLKSLRRAVSGSITPSGTLDYLKAVIRTFTGSVTPSGAITERSILKSLSGALQPAGQLTKSIGRLITGALSFLGSFTGIRVGPATNIRYVTVRVDRMDSIAFTEVRETFLYLDESES